MNMVEISMIDFIYTGTKSCSHNVTRKPLAMLR